jgi:hypothetical protein
MPCFSRLLTAEHTTPYAPLPIGFNGVYCASTCGAMSGRGARSSVRQRKRTRTMARSRQRRAHPHAMTPQRCSELRHAAAAQRRSGEPPCGAAAQRECRYFRASNRLPQTTKRVIWPPAPPVPGSG